MSEAERFFIAEAIRHARSLTFRDAVMFLDGMIDSLGGHPSQRQLRNARDLFNEGDAQLELIATGQLKFDLSPSEKS